MKRTVALILALMMVLPVSFISALAHGPGVGKNDIQNQSIHNALNQPLPETVVVDGNYEDTAWDKDEWLEADKRFGAWDVADPKALNFKYFYQLKLDPDYLYGVFRFSNAPAEELTLWLNDGSTSAKYTDKIVFALNGTTITSVTADGVAMATADTNAKAYPSQKFLSSMKVSGAETILEFRIYRKSFSTAGSFTHFVSAKTGGESLFYPKVTLENETIPPSPSAEWPANAIVIDQTDIEDVNSEKHLPSGIAIDGQLDEVIWNDLTDFRLQHYTTHQQQVAVENNTSAPLDLLSVGYSTNHTTKIPDHKHTDDVNNSSWTCLASSGFAGDIPYEKQLRFKYEIRTDGTNLYGAVVVLDYGYDNWNHNLPTDFTNNGVSNWESAYAGKTHLVVHFYDANGNKISTDGRMLEMTWHQDASKRNYNLYTEGGKAFGSVNHVYSDGSTEPMTMTKEFKVNNGAGFTRRDDYFVTYEFQIPLNYLSDSLKTGANGTPANFQVMIETYEEGNFSKVTNTSGTTALNKNSVRKYASTNKVTVSSNNTKGVSPSYAPNGTLQPSEWNSLLAADKLVDGMFRTENYDAGNVNTYQYEVVADYDYIYGAALLVTDGAFAINDNAEQANAFRLWLNDNVSGDGSKFVNCISFYLDSSGNVRASVANSGLNATYVKNGKYFEKVGASTDRIYGLDASMRVLTVDDDMKDSAKRSRFANMYNAIKAGRVAVLEFRIPLDFAGLDMDYFFKDQASYPPQFRYYTNFSYGLNTGKGLVHPVQPDKSGAAKYFMFTPTSWCTHGDNKVYTYDYYDNVVVDGVRTEHFWNDYSDFIGINPSNGYYSESIDADNIFTFGNTIKVSRDHLYGYAILNAEAVPGKSNYVLYINNDPSYRETVTHEFKFSVLGDGSMNCTAYDYINDQSIDISNTVYYAANHVNGYSNIEFVIDTRIFDPDNRGFEYTLSTDTVVSGDPNGDVVTLYYPDPRNAVGDRFTDMEITHVGVQPQEGCIDILTSDTVNATWLNGWAMLYVLFEKVDTKDISNNVYVVKGVDYGRNGKYDLTTKTLNDKQFLYIVYTNTNDEGATNNPNPERRNTLCTQYYNDFKVGTVVEFFGLDFTGADKTHTKYRVISNDLLYVNNINVQNKDYSGIIFTDDSVIANLNGWANIYVAFAPTATPGLYKVSAIDNNFNGTYELTRPANGFIYSLRDNMFGTDSSYSQAYYNNVVNTFKVGSYFHFDNLNLKKLQLESVGFRGMSSNWENRNHHFPSNNHWETKVALKIGELGYFYPEIIKIDGSVGDSGWDDDAWIDVKYGINGSLQSADFEQNGAKEFNYKYQLRTDGEYVYVAAVLDVESTGKVFTVTADDGKTLTYLSVPSFRLWVKSNADKYKEAISFTHLYDVRLGLGEDSNFYANYSSYKETVINNITFDVHGQTSASVDWYLKNATTTGCDKVHFDGSKMTYEGVQLRFAEHLPNGFKHPWGGNADATTGKATTQNSSNYGSATTAWDGTTKVPASAIYGETEEIMESMTSGINNGDAEKWHAHTDTKGFTIANEHGMWKADESDPANPKSIVEFKFKLDEIGCGNGESFEYFVQGAAAGVKYDSPFTMFNPPARHVPHKTSSTASGYYNPFWRWDSATSTKVTATAKYDMSLRNNYGPAVSLGAKVSDNFDGKGSNAIRFGGLYTEDYIRRQVVTNNYEAGFNTTDDENWSDRDLEGANKDGITNYWDVATVGIVFAPTQAVKLGADGMPELKVGSPSSVNNDSVGIYKWREGSNFADYEKYSFYVTLNGLPDAYKPVKWSFRSYVDYYNTDGTETYYDKILERSYNQVEAGAKLPEEGDDVGDGNEGDNEGGNTGVEIVKPNHNGEVIAYIPLDDRPVNLDRGMYLAESAGFDIIMPPTDIIDTKINNADTAEDDSEVGNVKAIYAWLKDVYDNDKADYFVISLDQLLSGGLVGSRDFAGINNLDGATSWNNDKDGAFYDPNLKFEKEVLDFLDDLTADETKKVVYFDSQDRLASTGQFNGFSSNNGATVNGVIRDNHYSFLRSGFAMQQRPAVDVTAADALDQIFANYQYNVNEQFILGENLYDANGNLKDPNKYYTLTIEGRQFAITAEYIDRYLKSRERKLRINEYIFDNTNIVQNAEYFYVGIDDSYPGETIQTAETAWLNHKGQGIAGYSVFSGIDEIGLMSMAALVTSLYCGDDNPVSTAIRYFGPQGAQNYAADDYGQNTLHENMIAHIKGVGATLGSAANRNALQVLVLTKQQPENGYGSAYDTNDTYINQLISVLEYNLKNNIPTAIVDGSTGTRDKLGRAIRDAGLDLGKVLGYGNWNTVANATGLSVSNAVARYAYLKNAKEVTDSSNMGFMKALGYSYIKDIGYIIEYKDVFSGSDTLANRKNYVSAFNTTANNLLNQLNACEIMVGIGEYEDIGDLVISKELYWPWNRMFEASFGLEVRGNTNIASNMSYTVTGTSAGYGANLTDGVCADTFNWGNNAWFALQKGTNMADGIVFNFDKATDVNNVRLHIFNGHSYRSPSGTGYIDNSGGVTKPEYLYIYALDSETNEYVKVGEVNNISQNVDDVYWAEAYFDTVTTTSIKIMTDVGLKFGATSGDDVYTQTNGKQGYPYGQFVMLNEVEIY